MIECRNCHHMNPDDAISCANCGFTLDWFPKPKPKPEPKPEPEPAPTEVVVEIEPAHVSVAAGARATARIAALAPELADAEWAVIGEASAFARVRRTPDAVLVELAPAVSEPPRTLPLRAVAVGSDVPGSAQGTVTVTSAVEPPNGGKRPSARRVVLVSVGVLVALVAVRGVYVLASRHAVEITAMSGVCLHTAPNTSSDTRIPLGSGRCVGPENGETVYVRCEEPGRGVYRLHTGFWPGGEERWMTTSTQYVAPSGDIPQC